MARVFHALVDTWTPPARNVSDKDVSAQALLNDENAACNPSRIEDVSTGAAGMLFRFGETRHASLGRRPLLAQIDTGIPIDIHPSRGHGAPTNRHLIFLTAFSLLFSSLLVVTILILLILILLLFIYYLFIYLFIVVINSRRQWHLSFAQRSSNSLVVLSPLKQRGAATPPHLPTSQDAIVHPRCSLRLSTVASIGPAASLNRSDSIDIKEPKLDRVLRPSHLVRKSVRQSLLPRRHHHLRSQ